MFSPRKWPYLTFIILVGSVVLYTIHGEDILANLLASSLTGQLLTLLLHPFVHMKSDPWHLVGNLVLGFFVMGTLIESWVALKWKYRYTMYGLAYISSLVVYIIMWKWRGPLIGLSGLVCAGSAFLLSYYLSFFRHLPIRRLRDTLGPLGVGYLIPFVITYIPYTLTYAQSVEIQSTAIYHCLAFFFGFIFAVALLLRRQVQDIFRRGKHLTSHPPTKGLL